MTYVTSVSIPFAFQADDDEQARRIAARIAKLVDDIEFELGDLRDTYGAEQTDGAMPYGLSEIRRFEPQREIEPGSFWAFDSASPDHGL